MQQESHTSPSNVLQPPVAISRFHVKSCCLRTFVSRFALLNFFFFYLTSEYIFAIRRNKWYTRQIAVSKFSDRHGNTQAIYTHCLNKLCKYLYIKYYILWTKFNLLPDERLFPARWQSRKIWRFRTPSSRDIKILVLSAFFAERQGKSKFK